MLQVPRHRTHAASERKPCVRDGGVSSSGIGGSGGGRGVGEACVVVELALAVIKKMLLLPKLSRLARQREAARDWQIQENVRGQRRRASFLRPDEQDSRRQAPSDTEWVGGIEKSGSSGGGETGSRQQEDWEENDDIHEAAGFHGDN